MQALYYHFTVIPSISYDGAGVSGIPFSAVFGKTRFFSVIHNCTIVNSWISPMQYIIFSPIQTIFLDLLAQHTIDFLGFI